MDDADQETFRWPDILVFVVVLLASVAIGLFQACTGGRQKDKTEYLLANRSQRCVPVGLSILVTFQSAILFIGVPAEIYTQGVSYVLFHIGMAFSVIISAYLIVPLLFPLKLTSVYQYLERRFESKTVRIIGCLIGMLNMCLYMGVTVFAPATAIEAVSGFPAWASIIVLSALATLYTSLGGLRAVIWTDVFQFCIMCCGILAILIQGSLMQGGFNRIWEAADNGTRIDWGGFSPDPHARHTVWSLVIGGTLTWLANIGVNQANVQRFNSVPDMKTAQLSLLLSMPGFVVFGVLASLVGLIVFSYYTDVGCDPLASGRISNPNQLVPLFVVQVFPFLPGFAGLFVASLCCASLSTISSSINSLSAMLWEDILRQAFPNISEARETLVLKCLVFIFGAIALGVAFLSLSLGGPATQIALSFFGASGGPLLGLFLLGALFPWANWIGASVGSLTGLALCLWIAIGRYTLPAGAGLPSAGTHNCPQTNGHHSYSNGHNDTYVTQSAVTFVSEGEELQLESNPLGSLYSISYLWYSGIGLLVVIGLGLIVSLITGKTDPADIEQELLVPVADKLCCCLSKKCRHKIQIERPEKVATEEPREDNKGSFYDNPSLASNGTVTTPVSYETHL